MTQGIIEECIGPDAVRFVFLRLRADADIPQLIQNVRTALETSSGVSVTDARTVLGIFDVMVEYRAKGIAPDFTRLGTLPGVTNSAEFICYEWNGDALQEGRTQSESPLSVFSLLRLHQQVLNQGLLAERELIERIRRANSRRPDRQFAIFGCLGPAELVVVTYGESIIDLASGLRDLSDAIYQDGGEPYVSKSLSFVCASPIVFEDPTKPGSQLARHFWDKLALEPALTPGNQNESIPHLLVNCEASSHDDLTNWVRKRCNGGGPFGTVDTILGLSDLLIRPAPDANWRDFLWGCLQLRREFAHSIQSTNLVIGMPALVPSRTGPQANPADRRVDESPMKPVDLSSGEAAGIINVLGQPLGESLVNAIYTYNSMLHDDPASHGLRDIYPFVCELHKMALETSRDPALDLPQRRLRLGQCIETLRSGLHHHAAGAFVGIDRPAWRIVAVQGGLQRVTVGMTQALRRLVWSVFGERWGGFSIISGAFRGFHSILGVINIPIDAFGDIRHLWTLMHEIGHLASEKFWAATNLSQEFDDLAHAAGWAVSVHDRQKWLEFLQAVACDLFAFRLVFAGDCAEFVRATVEQRLRSTAYAFESDEDFNEFAFRLGCVFLEAEFLNSSNNYEGGDTSLLEKGEFDIWFENFSGALFQALKDLGEEVKFDEERLYFIKERLFILQFIICDFHIALANHAIETGRSGSNSSLVNAILDSHHVNLSSPDPAILLSSLPFRDSTPSFGGMVSMILTFWHDAMVSYRHDELRVLSQ